MVGSEVIQVEKFRLPYPVGGQDVTISMPYIAQILHIGQWGGDFILWGLIDTDEIKRGPITIWIVPDKTPLCNGVKIDKKLIYVCTVQMKFEDIVRHAKLEIEEKQTPYHFFIEAKNAFLIQRTVLNV